MMPITETQMGVYFICMTAITFSQLFLLNTDANIHQEILFMPNIQKRPRQTAYSKEIPQSTIHILVKLVIKYTYYNILYYIIYILYSSFGPGPAT